MKKKIQTKQAHKKPPTGSTSLCSIQWSSNGHHIITSSFSDDQICIHDAVSPENPSKTLISNCHDVTALAVSVSPNSTFLAYGSMDRYVNLYELPQNWGTESGHGLRSIIGFKFPVSALTFNKSGTLLAAAAGDDEDIKLVSLSIGLVSIVLKGHKGHVTSLAFDPRGEYFASLDFYGTVVVWELRHGNTVHVLNKLAPSSGLIDFKRSMIAWSPDGKMLAVPGMNNVVMYDRDTAEKLFALGGRGIQPICLLSWSPNGNYLAASDLGRQVLIWDVANKQVIDRQKFTQSISSIAWKPKGNALAVMNVRGKYGVWESVVPSTMKSPFEDVPSLCEDIRGVSGLNSKKRPWNNFFDKVAEKYEEARLDKPDLALRPRTAGSLRNRMMTIKRDIVDFAVYYNVAESLVGNKNGYNEDDVEARALQLYFDDKGEHMPCLHAWKYIRQFPDWRTKLDENLPCTEIDNDGIVQSDSDNNQGSRGVKRSRVNNDRSGVCKRPIGRNGAKKAQSDEKAASSNQSHYSNAKPLTDSMALFNERMHELEAADAASRVKDRKMKLALCLMDNQEYLTDEQKEVMNSLIKEACS